MRLRWFGMIMALMCFMAGGSVSARQLYEVTISALDVSPAGNQAVVATVSGSIFIYNLDTSTVALTLHAGSEYISEVAWSPDGTAVAAITYYGQLMVWDMPSGNQRLPVTVESPYGFASQLTALSWSPDSNRLAVAGISLGTAIIDAFTGELLTFLQTGETYDLAWNPIDNLVVASLVGVHVWDGEELTNRLPALPLTEIPGTFSIAVALNADGTQLAIVVETFARSTAEGDRSLVRGMQIQIVDMSSFSTLISTEIPEGGNRLIWSDDSTYLAFGSFDDTIHIWETSSLHPVDEALVGNAVLAFDWSGEAEIIYAANDGQLNRVDVEFQREP